MGVYNHFSSKFGIIDALFILGFERLSEAMGSLNQIDDPIAALTEAGRKYRESDSGPSHDLRGDVPTGHNRLPAQRAGARSRRQGLRGAGLGHPAGHGPGAT